MFISRTVRCIHSTSLLRTAARDNPYEHMEVYGNLSRPCTLRFEPVDKSPKVQQLIEKSKGPWTEMALEEKIALYRAMFPYSIRDIEKGDGKTLEIVLTSIGIILTGIGLFMLSRYFILRNSEPKFTRTKEWKEAARIKNRENLANPIFGVSSKKE